MKPSNKKLSCGCFGLSCSSSNHKPALSSDRVAGGSTPSLGRRRNYVVPLFVRGKLPGKRGKTPFKTFLTTIGARLCHDVDYSPLKILHSRISGILNKHNLLYQNGKVCKEYLRSIRSLARSNPHEWETHSEWVKTLDSEPDLEAFSLKHPYNPWKYVLNRFSDFFKERFREIIKVFRFTTDKPKLILDPLVLKSSAHLGVSPNYKVDWGKWRPVVHSAAIVIPEEITDVKEMQAMMADETPYLLTPILRRDDKIDPSCNSLPENSEYFNLGLKGHKLGWRRFYDTLKEREKERKTRFLRNLDLYFERGGFYEFISVAVPVEDHLKYLCEIGPYARNAENDDQIPSEFEESEFLSRETLEKNQ